MSNDCGCNSNNNLNILDNNMNNVNQVNMNQGNMNQATLNNIAAMNNLNQQNVNQNALNRALIMENVTKSNGVENIGPLNNLIVDKNINNSNDKKISNNSTNMITLKDIKIILYILVALSINEAFRFFIPQCIRLNKGSSSLYLYYAIGTLALLIGVNIFSK